MEAFLFDIEQRDIVHDVIRRHDTDGRLYLKEQTNLFSAPLKLFHVSPAYCLSSCIKLLPNLTYIAGNIVNQSNIALRMDLSMTPIRSETFDAIICIHVLEHVEEDRMAIKELFRILKPGGWATLSVPVRMDQKTYKDSPITSPEEKKLAFGGHEHVRFYGYDFVERLEQAGFIVKIDYSRDTDSETNRKCGLPDDEIIFLCTIR